MSCYAQKNYDDVSLPLGVLPFSTRIINQKLTISHLEISRIFGVNATFVSDLLMQFSSLEGQKRTVFVDSTGLLPPTRYAFAPAFRAIVPHLPDADLASVVLTALEVKLCSVGEVV